MSNEASRFPITNAPDVWGEGALFAFSGADGDTDSTTGFTGSYMRCPGAILFHTPVRRILTVAPLNVLAVSLAMSDCFSIRTKAGDVTVAYSAWHTLVGSFPAGTAITLTDEQGKAADRNGSTFISIDKKHPDAYVLMIGDGRFALAYGTTEDEAKNRAKEGLQKNAAAELTARLAFYADVPLIKSGEKNMLLNKCVSVMKVNTLASEHSFKQKWSTPDRVPHKDMWLWDSVFHSLAMNHISPDLSWQFIKSVLEAQREDGFVSHQMRPTGWRSEITQPPILAWGVWENYHHLKNISMLKYAFPKLERYITWDLQHRNKNNSGLLVWEIEGNPLCRSGESGLDNSPRFDEAVNLDAVDFSVFAAHDMMMLAHIAEEIGDTQKSLYWEQASKGMSQKIHALLWNDADGFYYDRHADGRLSTVKAVTGFLPLMLEDIPAKNVERLIAHMRNGDEFATEFPLPSAALNEPTWSTDMWRGATWINTNYLTALGLAKHGHTAEAHMLRDITVNYVMKYYKEYGVVFEFYDATDELPPVKCARKGPSTGVYDLRKKMDSIRDYHWTAALTLCFILME
ncbi:MAG: hypothetical protein HZC28_11545 [Spirochaetes bacterium]|nr:hypothetical protein [Spirochaetota bacterium]